MHLLLRTALAASFSLAWLPCQLPAPAAIAECWPWRLSFATAAAPDGDLLRAAIVRLAVGHDRWLDGTAADDASHDVATGLLLAWLWLGDDHRARAVLRRSSAATAANGDPAAMAWSLVHHYWFLRATSDAATVRAELPRLAGWAEQIAGAAGPGLGTLAREVLALHAVACMGGLLDTLDRLAHPAAWQTGPPRPLPGTAWARRAAVLRQDFEQRHWSATTSSFAGDAAARPADRLLPCGIGMLATTGDRTLQNLRATLRALPPAASATNPRERALVVTALAQCEAELALPLRELTQTLAGRALAQDLGAAGRALDAILFAWTGVRMATGPGIDEDWVRLRPRLPPDGTALQVRGVRHDGWTADLQFQRRTDAMKPAEQELLVRCSGGAAATTPARLHGRLSLRGRPPPRGHWQAVVHCGGRQLIAPVWADAPFEFAVAATVPDDVLGQDLSGAADAPRDR